MPIYLNQDFKHLTPQVKLPLLSKTLTMGDVHNVKPKRKRDLPGEQSHGTQWCNHNKCKWVETQVDHSEIVTLNQQK